MKTDGLIEISRLFEIFSLVDGRLFWKEGVPKCPAGKEAGFINDKGYRLVFVGRQRFRIHRLVFAMTHGRWPKDQIDHINGIKTDNRPENLREATDTENKMNRGPRRRATNGLVGVRRRGRETRWIAYIRVNKTTHYLGRFFTATAAHEAYLEASDRLRGEFAPRGDVMPRGRGAFS